MSPQPTSKPKSIVLNRFAPLLLQPNTPKGRGIFAGKPIPSGTIIDTCPVLLLDAQENKQHIEKTSLYHYTYNWPITSQDEPGKPHAFNQTQAVIFGLGSMFNHSTRNQNVGWLRDLENQLVVYRALRDIQQGEELCISYGDHLTFVDADRPEDDKEMEEEEEEEEEEENEDDVLGRIELNGSS